MQIDPEDAQWIRKRLSDEADRHPFELDALLDRVMPDVYASLEEGSDSAASATARAARKRWAPERSPDPRAWQRKFTARESIACPPAPRRQALPVMFAAAAVVVVSVLGWLVPVMHRDRAGYGGAPLQGGGPAGMMKSSPPAVSLGPPLASVSPSRSSAYAPASGPPAEPAAALPRRFQWRSSGALIVPKPDPGHAITGVRDPSVVYSGGRWHVFATVTGPSGLNLAYLSFTDWASAGSASWVYLDRTPIGAGYRAAPEVFYFAPRKLWYLVYQTGNASYSTNPDIGNPYGWSPPRNFYPGTPDIIRKNLTKSYWVDMWVTCDQASCYLFSTDQQGHLYRSQTAAADFPNGMSDPVVALQDPNRFGMLGSTSVYSVAGTGQYLLLMNAIGSDGHAYYRSWTAPGLDGAWTPLAADEAGPFAGLRNVSFPADPRWTSDLWHGQLVRRTNDQTLSISPCHLRMLYQGGSQQLGLLTQTGAGCTPG